jgi:hypothetical protein
MLSQKPFQEAAEEIARHPFLLEASAGTLPLAKWERYFSARLETGPGFVIFLERLQRQAEILQLADVATAVKENRQEELGIVDGEVIPERAHHEWRRWFRDGMKDVFFSRGMTLRSGPPADFTEVNGYPHAFNALNARGDVVESMGALAVLELGLGYEYTEILKGMGIVFPGELTSKQKTYLVSHARHEERHFREVYEPLAAICRSREEVDRALRGATIAKQTKLGFLDGAYRGEPGAA